MLGGRLPETENKRKCQISGLKSGCGRLRNSSSGRVLAWSLYCVFSVPLGQFVSVTYSRRTGGHGPRDLKRFGCEEKWGLGTRQVAYERVFEAVFDWAKKRHFYVKKLLFYKLNGCKNTAFLQKYIFVKKQLFYVKNLFCYKRYFCKKAAFLCKNPAILHI